MKRMRNITVIGLFLMLIITGCGSATPAAQLEPTIAVTAGSPEPTVDPNLSTPASIATIATMPSSTIDPAVSAAATCTKLNLNTLTEDQLMQTIPDFTSRMVREFLEYRPYVSIQQFRREIGKYVDAAQVTAWEQYVYVPIAVNDADADTLMQIPGVTAEIAAELATGRPYTDNIAFLAMLGRQINADQVVAANCYLAQ
ncbi:MAG: hypothetical protein U0528_07140 [Anaerolineae bacterium]